ncbi:MULTISPECIES: DUF6069 family protein [unclassified Micromonospora]|uniref:DUF6069 family protein n=1 Tax=unclassified Micromonospora TaxID=2617518 RepID=UPI0034074391
MADLPRTAVVALATAVAVVVNLIVYAIGRAAGGSFLFTADDRRVEVDAVTVADFSALPLALGLTAVAVLASRYAWVVRAALIVGPALAVLTIATMTLPAGLDATSTITLAACHLTLAPIIVVAVSALGRRARRATAGPVAA